MTGFWTLLRRESMRFLSLPNQTLWPSVVNLALYVIVFGFLLGQHMQPLEGHPFIAYVFPGLILMGSTVAAFQNSATSLFISRWEHFIDDLLVAPIPYYHMVSAYALAAALRGFIVGLVSLTAGCLLIQAPLAHPFLFILALVATSFCFGSVGILNGLFATRWDHIAILQNYIVTPMVFLGGVFYSTAAMPESLRWINHANPLFYMVSMIRYACLGTSDVPFTQGLAVTIGLSVAFFALSVELFRRGTNLRT